MLKHGIKSGVWNRRDEMRRNGIRKTESITGNGKWNMEIRIICSMMKHFSRNRPFSCKHQRTKIHTKFNCSQYKHVSYSSPTKGDMKRAFRPDQESKCFLAEFPHIYRCLFATSNCSYLTGITFKLSMAFIVLAVL